jgi:outer membrane protein assembly factor BamB
MNMPILRARPFVLFCGCLLLPAAALAQGAPRGFWTSPDANAAHTRWQKAETQINTETVAKDFKFLWKLKLGNDSSKSPSFSEPILYPGQISGKGFKDFVFVADASTLYGIDSELGELDWKKDFSSSRGKACGNIQVVTEAPQIIHFGAPKPAVKPGAPKPPEPAQPGAPRRIGLPGGGGYFSMKGVYVVTGDGQLHEEIMATGLDFAPPIKFLPGGGSSFGLGMNDKIVYGMSGTGCKNTPNTLWSMDINTPDYPISSLKAQKLTIAGVTGPAIGRDGTVYVLTSPGPSAPPVYGGSVMALEAQTLKSKDWYTPPSTSSQLNAGPVVIAYKDKELIAAPGKDGSLVLLDPESLGGPNHHTALAETGSLSKGTKHDAWEGLATAQSGSDVWLFASVSGPVESDVTFASTNGDAPHGSIVAFKVEEKDGHVQLTPAWKSRDLTNPAPPVFANGIIFALDGGSHTAHATLYALDAATGKQLFSSGDAIQSYTNLAGMSVGDGHVFFITRDNTLYSFGIPLEH